MPTKPGSKPPEHSDLSTLAARLQQLDHLEIGPVRLEPKRCVCPYTLHSGNTQSIFEFIYRFEEDVFNPEDAEDLNLAAMMTAQVGLNYGLFFREITFHGKLDFADQSFLREMLDNTSREIYVVKFLHPNPFLVGDASRLPLVKSERYTLARLNFSATKTPVAGRSQPAASPQTSWNVDSSRHAVASSGGKDSLLSFGLLKEMGQDVYPIFINESGRHWYTALNAFRHFRTTYPETKRVWTNSDRFFAWMLRHLPFIRQDFARMRFDEYPIRLWTVAVFLFGTLPLLKKYRIGRLVIGDEHDTTARQTFGGITHYNGLYDQSRYFDNALSRYYRRKGWNINQFSLLRTLSELLIEKTLARRYPDLQRFQVSCHAAHIQDDRVHPCGQCEKCRRIVSMLTALNVDPSLCGYSPDQIQACLEQFSRKGAHQEAAGVRQLYHLLHKQGIDSPDIDYPNLPHHPEILQLRFDPERSPVECFPVDLRLKLYPLLLEHSDGAVLRFGRNWAPFDPLSEEALNKPYPYQGKNQVGTPETDQAKRAPEGDYLLEHMTWKQARHHFKQVDVALLPVGSTEQHGPHLPLDTDSFDAYLLANKVASACSPPRPFVLPLIPYGVSYHHEDFSGTLSVNPDTLAQMVYEVGLSAARHGITKLLMINGHGGNIPALQFAAQMINRDAHIFTCVETGETSRKDVDSLVETPNDVHAGEEETSTSLYTRPELVQRQVMRKFIPRFSSRYLDFSSKRSVEWNARVAKISPTGVLGDPTKASYEKGRKIWEVMVRHLVEFVEDLKGMTLDEIFQRRL
jgi:creatinine amidohydrolase/Fe(II)-dependent formamide hydrolase-like protein